MRIENVETVVRDETLKGRGLEIAPGQNLGKIPTLWAKKRTRSHWRQKKQLQRPE